MTDRGEPGSSDSIGVTVYNTRYRHQAASSRNCA
jgi:hypothetical protein